MKTLSFPALDFEKFFDVISEGSQQYCELMSLYNGGEGCSNTRFQKLYTYFYRVRRSSAWLQEYFNIMGELSKKPNTSFSECLRLVDRIDARRVEISFASKMYHTINPDMPIWDSQVRNILGMCDIPLIGRIEERESVANFLYSRLCEKFNDLLSEESIKIELEKINSSLPLYSKKISVVKKLDYLLWAAGK